MVVFAVSFAPQFLTTEMEMELAAGGFVGIDVLIDPFVTDPQLGSDLACLSD